MILRVLDAERGAVERVDDRRELAMAGPVGRAGDDVLERGRAVTPSGRPGRVSGRRSSPDRFSSGIRGTIPYRLYSALEMGWALSVAVASVIPLPGGGRTRSSSRRPIPLACSSGSTNSIERNQWVSRTQAETNATIRSRCGFGLGRVGSDGDQEAVRVGALRVAIQAR